LIFVGQREPVFLHQLPRRTDALSPASLRREHVGEIAPERHVNAGAVLPHEAPVVLLDRHLHVLDRDVEVARRNHRLLIAEPASHTINIAQLPDGRPCFVSAPPIRARRQPHGERFGEVFVGMLLRVPTCDVPHVLAAERHGTVPIAIAAVVRAEQSPPFGSGVEPVCVIERMTGLVTQVHHDLALVFEIVHLALEPRQVRIGEVERNADHRLPIGAAPPVGEVTHRTRALESLAVQLAMELMDEALDRGTFEPQSQLADALAEEGFDFRRGLLEIGHGQRCY
jgi:hypothetical protein